VTEILWKCYCSCIGAERLIQHLHAHNVPMAVATRYILMLCGISLVKLLKHFMIMCLELKYKCLLCSSHRQHFELKTTKHGPIFALMHHIVVGDDPAVVHGKPSPDIFLVAAQRFEVSVLPAT
jgi:beta-phosphoglucomutase-like phosphatase (HAD superfamily)